MSETRTLHLPDEAATVALGRQLGRVAAAGDVIALLGPLGAGKTTLMHGLAAALGVVGPVPSPTFVLLRQYQGRLALAHADAYRLGDAQEAWSIGLDELLPGDGVTVVEWADRIASLLPAETLTVTLTPRPVGRTAELAAPSLARWLEGLPW
ncbi:MAG: tRNA (adenosine(37)-N6)-threonylcarbamoyltransferase complex ATPase subunit type 1 TsaE [Fimbriimonadaceae bacterium]|nr:tRNA (adenosine(37)-N6)-threonylcarbamoyltransferase complex ATPase subunit type 1 TsaE [Fimbriimonadaceae bacterium]